MGVSACTKCAAAATAHERTYSVIVGANAHDHVNVLKRIGRVRVNHIFDFVSFNHEAMVFQEFVLRPLTWFRAVVRRDGRG